MFDADSFDLILCHNILEYVDDPCAVLRSAAGLLRNPSGLISILVRNQAGEVLKSVIQAGDLAAAEHNLTAEWGRESLYGGRLRVFTAERLQAMLAAASLAITAERGVRVVSDYLPPMVSRNDVRADFRAGAQAGQATRVRRHARYTQCLAHRVAPVMKERA